ERESFENVEVAAYMNEHFINIKIDREERPDLDHIYMDAVQAIAGNGGWPLNVFLTSDAKPFYGGTYFPPVKAYNRPSWMDVLKSIHEAWVNKKAELVEQAEQLLNHISLSAEAFGSSQSLTLEKEAALFTREQCKTINENILKAADAVQGGFGAAPKFPQTFTIQYLLAYGSFFKNEKSLQHAEFSLKQMLNGGIYDHLAGGMSRYSTDTQWLAPHFEKMLYDNALLVNVLSDAYQITKDTFYADSIHKTLAFFIREMRHSEGGFFAALDADSEGEEGKFYVWQKAEIDRFLGKDSPVYCKWYGVTENGNWEEKNILHINSVEEIFAEENQLSVPELIGLIQRSNDKLLAERDKRPHPHTDDKMILGWNALFLTALCKAAAALGDDSYKTVAISLFGFIMAKYSGTEIISFHTYKNGQAKHPAFLDDYAYLVQACIALQELTGDQQYLLEAKKLSEYVIENFENPATGFFYYTHRNQSDVITRKVEFYDGAVPSGNSIMAANLLYLSVVFENAEWRTRALKMVHDLQETIIKYPTSFAVWGLILLNQVVGINEIVITGSNIHQIINELLKLYLPNKVLQSSQKELSLPLLINKTFASKTLIYLCRNYSCQEPVDSINDLKKLLKNTVD
ncbi:MAG: thioredoxin domain-containing protein, partial [Ferruginibacter sp.]